MTVHDIIFPQNIIKKVQSSKFFVVLSRANKECATQLCSIDESGQVIFEDACELEASLIKNRQFLTKHFRIILRQLKPLSNKSKTPENSSNKDENNSSKNEINSANNSIIENTINSSNNHHNSPTKSNFITSNNKQIDIGPG